jgi:hypothetical protein
LAALLVVGSLAAVSRADVGPNPEYGRNIAPREQTKVTMTAETVFIRLTPEKALVRAVFHLENTGEATALEVGFPDAVAPGSGSREKGPQSVAWLYVHDFVAKVDGQTVEHRPRFLQRKDSPFEKPPPGKENQWLFAGWLIWDMNFERGQKHRVQVDYWVPYQARHEVSLLGAQSFTYILRTGAPWQGSIGKATITVSCENDLTRERLSEIRPAGCTEIKNGIRWVFKDLEPTEDVSLCVQKYADPNEAATAYLRRADEEARRGLPGVGAHLLACAVQCQEAAGRYTEAIETCRLIIAFEKGGQASGARSWVMQSRGTHLPWECTLVRCLVKLGRLDEARMAAAEAFAAICAMPPWMKSSPGPQRDRLEASAKQLEAFAAGGPYVE